MNHGIAKAVELAGGQTALARLLERETGQKCGQGRVWNWLTETHPVPAEWAVRIEDALAGEVHRSEIRPDLWDAPRKTRRTAR